MQVVWYKSIKLINTVEVNQVSMVWDAPVKKICGDLWLIMITYFRVYGKHLSRIQGDMWPHKEVSKWNDSKSLQ